MTSLSLGELARILDGELIGDADTVITGIRPIDEAGPDHVTFLASSRHEGQLERSSAAGFIVSRQVVLAGRNLIRVDDPYLGFARTMEVFFDEVHSPAGISDLAYVHPEAVVGEDPSIHPFASVEKGVVLGNRVTLMSGARVGRGSQVGDDTVLHPNVVLEHGVKVGRRVIIHGGAVIGSDGFGFARDGEKHVKIIQAGTVRIEDDVEIGACTAVDRAVIGETVIGEGTKVDNLVQVAHNVTVGRNCVIVSQAGIAGSAVIEDNATLAGRAAVAGHLRVGAGAVVAGAAGVTKDVPQGATVAGFPAVDINAWRKGTALSRNLETMMKRIRYLEKELHKLKESKKERD